MARVSPVKRPQNLVSFEPDIFDDTEFENFQADKKSAHRAKERVKPSLLSGSAITSPQSKTKPNEYPDTGLSSPSVPALEIGKVGGTDRRTAGKLKKGRLDIEARLDLHGSTLAQAHDRLYGFITSAYASGARCVLVVTGKGRSTLGETGKLKAAVPRWLNEPAFRPYVLSLSYAQQKDGGEGALYILLRKKGNLR
jgi:DNA-nicking Smr family endonuclease